MTHKPKLAVQLITSVLAVLTLITYTIMWGFGLFLAAMLPALLYKSGYDAKVFFGLIALILLILSGGYALYSTWWLSFNYEKLSSATIPKKILLGVVTGIFLLALILILDISTGAPFSNFIFTLYSPFFLYMILFGLIYLQSSRSFMYELLYVQVADLEKATTNH